VDDVPSFLPSEDLAGEEDLHEQEEVCGLYIIDQYCSYIYPNSN